MKYIVKAASLLAIYPLFSEGKIRPNAENDTQSSLFKVRLCYKYELVFAIQKDSITFVISSKYTKNIRSVVGVYNKENKINQNAPRELGEVQDPSTLRCFYECVNQGMTADECVEYIENLLGGKDLPGHEIPDLKIKIHNPRTVAQVRETYWMFGIPTNIYGEVDCKLNGGNVRYPWPWLVNGVGISIPEIPCSGLDVNECCDKVIDTLIKNGIPLVDDKNNCFSCWPHQEPLEPVIGAGGEVAYLEHKQATDGTCEEVQLSLFEVQTADTDASNAVTSVVGDLDALLAAEVPMCADLVALYRALLKAARAVPQAMSKVTGMLCGFVCGSGGTFTITLELKKRLLFIRRKLTEIIIKSDENCIIIYTDRHGNVIEPPKIGGSREGLDVDLDDPDCESPVSSPVTIACDGENEMINEYGTECECVDMYVRNVETGTCEMCEAPFVYKDGACVKSSPVPAPVTQPVAPVPVYTPVSPVPVYKPVATFPVYKPFNLIPVYKPFNLIPVFFPVAPVPVYKPVAPVPVYKPVAPVPVYKPVAPVPVYKPVAPVPVYKPVPPVPVYKPVAPVPVYKPVAPIGSCTCNLPDFLKKFALITEGDANLAPHNLYKGMAIGGTLDRYDTGYTIVANSNYSNSKCYIYKEAKSFLNINYNGLGVQKGATLSQAGVDFEALKCLAHKIKPYGNGDQNSYNVFVLTKGGTYNLYDFHKEGQGENNGKTLVVFNTSEDITLTNAGGRQFGPSVLAPFSKVTLSNTGFVDGWVVSKSFNSLSSGDQMHGDAYSGPISCY